MVKKPRPRSPSPFSSEIYEAVKRERKSKVHQGWTDKLLNIALNRKFAHLKGVARYDAYRRLLLVSQRKYLTRFVLDQLDVSAPARNRIFKIMADVVRAENKFMHPSKPLSVEEQMSFQKVWSDLLVSHKKRIGDVFREVYGTKNGDRLHREFWSRYRTEYNKLYGMRVTPVVRFSAQTIAKAAEIERKREAENN